MLGELKTSKTYAVVILILLAALVGGLNPVLTKISIKEIPPFSFSFIRFLSAGLIFLPILLYKKQKFDFKKIKTILLVSLLSTTNIILFIIGLDRTTAAVSQILYAGVPLITAIFSFFVLKEKIQSTKILGVLLGFTGVVLIILLPVWQSVRSLHGDLVGNLIIFTAVCSFSLYTVLSKKYQIQYTPLELVIAFVFSTILVCLFLIPLDFVRNPFWWNGVSAAAWWGLIFVGVIGTGFYYFIYQSAIKNATPVIASMILYLQLIFGIFLAMLMLGEKLTFGFVIGAVLALIGVALVTNFGRPHKND